MDSLRATSLSSVPDSPSSPEPSSTDPLAAYERVRRNTRALAEGLPAEDFVVQSMPDVSPLKWHLAHTTWFFEEFVLTPHGSGYEPLDARYAYLFNSYYVQAGERHCRDQRGYLSRPTVREVMEYRDHVDAAMEGFLQSGAAEPRALELVELGVNHEQQHQELMLTDLKHVFSVNPLRPSYRPGGGTDSLTPGGRAESEPLRWIEFSEGTREVGWGGAGFSYDNERPRHRVFLEPFALAERPVTCGEVMEFIADGGYRRPELWMSDGWVAVQERDWSEPFYWEDRDGEWWQFTLAGMRPIDPREPACHLSWYEADAFARWAGARLPTEAEWEVAAEGLPVRGNLFGTGRYHPSAREILPDQDEDHGSGNSRAPESGGLAADRPRRMYGDVWEWTGSAYRPYPGFRTAPGAVGEYNGKFMSNQLVLRGGSCATDAFHLRPTYRNFFHPDACWQFSGLRLARDPG